VNAQVKCVDMRQRVPKTACCTIAVPAQAAANALMYFRFRGENPLAVGNWDWRSAESRSMILVPQPSRVIGDPQRGFIAVSAATS
jgi:hypothetical protein